jgi:drug/metabolite transporter (DMT)-like permease
LLDLVLKLYAKQRHSIGLLIFGIGAVWLALHAIYIAATDQPVAFDPVTLQYGLLAAVCVTISNVLLLECLVHMPISSASTIYRLNTIPLVIMAVIFLGETLTIAKGLGVAAGIVTVMLLYQAGSTADSDRSHIRLYLSLIILAAVIRALYGIFTKAGITRGGDANVLMLLAALGFICGGLLYAVFRERTGRFTHQMAVYMLVAGTLVYSVVWLLTTALTLGDASVVVPIANMGFIAAFLFSVLLRLEVLTRRKMLAIVSAMLSVTLLTAAAQA